MFIGFVLVGGGGWVDWIKNYDKDYYKIYLEKINYIYKNNFDLFIL